MANGFAFENLFSGEVAGCGVLVDTVRYLPADGDNGPKLVYLLGFSAQTSVARAAWANLIAPRCGYLHLEDDTYQLADGGKGWELRTSRLSHGVDELVLFPPCADRWAGVEEILVVDRPGRSPAETLMRFLEYRSGVPLDGRWAEAIWGWARDGERATTLEGFGPPAWLVRVTDELLLASIPEFLASANALTASAA
jgi:hypothetical protein